jgi:hypothetical protein
MNYTIIKNIFTLNIFSLILFLCSPVPALALSVEMTVDRPVVSLEDEIILKIVVRNEKTTEEPIIHNIDNFSLTSRGTSTSMSIINNQITREIIYSYSLIPEKEGIFTIGPATIRKDNKTYRSNAVTITVKKAPAAIPSKERNIYITSEIDNLTPYVNEQVVYTFRLLSRVNFMNAQADLPEFDGFWKEEMGKQRDYQKIINGQRWNVTELTYALFPLKSGELKIEGSQLTCEVIIQSPGRSRRIDPFFNDPFFNQGKRKRKILRSKPIVLSVRPLPKEGKPTDFSGLVGQFTLDAALSKKEVKVGDTTTLTITIEGNGNVRSTLLPDIDNNHKIKTYDDTPSYKHSVKNGQLIGLKTFTRAIVPLISGEISLSELKISYFDPLTARYNFARVPELAVHTLPRDEKEEPLHLAKPLESDSKQEIKVLGKDLMPIYMKLDALENQKIENKTFYLLLVLSTLPAFGFLLSFMYRKRQEKYRADSGILRRKKALKASQALLKKLELLEGQNFYDKASQILRAYIGDKLNIDGNTLTSDEIKHRIEPLKLSLEMKEKVCTFARNLEARLYSGQTLEKKQKKELLSQLKELIEKVDKEIKD